MNSDEIAAQLEFFRDIGVDSLAVGAVCDLPGAHRAPLQDLEDIRADIGDCQRCKLAPAPATLTPSSSLLAKLQAMTRTSRDSRSSGGPDSF